LELKTPEEKRKRQFTGRLTCTVSLPKKWIDQNQLGKGSAHAVIESIRRTAEYASDMAEVALNLAVQSILTPIAGALPDNLQKGQR
jgi:phosphate uptake regulator